MSQVKVAYQLIQHLKSDFSEASFECWN